VPWPQSTSCRLDTAKGSDFASFSELRSSKTDSIDGKIYTAAPVGGFRLLKNQVLALASFVLIFGSGFDSERLQ
jgi:hypothetical protein